MSLKNLPIDERPRERLARLGSSALSTIELLAILLGSGTRKRSVLEMASDLLAHFGSLQNLADASLKELQQVPGIGMARSIQLKAAFELFHRLEEKGDKTALDTPAKVYALIRGRLVLQKTEVLLLILRDVRRCLLHQEVISRGTLTQLLMHPREVFHLAIRHLAHSVIIAHNHPSGDPTPSTPDLEMTQILFQASQIMGITLADHLIVGEKGYFSFYEKGLLHPSRRMMY